MKSASELVYVNDDIIRRPFVDLLKDEISFDTFAEECAKTIGGKSEDWMNRNKSLLGLFGNKHKKLRVGTRFKIPHFLVEKAIREYSSSSSLSTSLNVSPSANHSSSATDSMNTIIPNRRSMEDPEFVLALEQQLRKSMEYIRELPV